MRAFADNPMGWLAAGYLVLLVFVVLAAPVLAPHDPLAQNLSIAERPPLFQDGGLAYPLGTDKFGRDILTRLLFGGRTSLLIGGVAATISAIVGTLLGLLAGYYERTVGAVLLRLADIQFSLPFYVIAIAVVAIFGPGLNNLLILLSFWGWATYARTMASSVQRVKMEEFVEAARVIGASRPRILFGHILPNVGSLAIILWSTSAGTLILAESALSFIGLGVRSPEFSWGTMLADARTELVTAWWIAVMPGLALTMTVVAFNLVGDFVSDALNPQIARRGAQSPDHA